MSSAASTSGTPAARDGAFEPARPDYDWSELERRWQRAWREQRAFATPRLSGDEHGASIFAAAPFTSGKAHMGHVRSYTIADAYARYLRATGRPVLFTMGFDAFGLPAELAAIGAAAHPREWVEKCAAAMQEQFEAMGFSFDWERTFISSEEDMYRWSQWLFVTLLERDLVYQKDARVDWCQSCETVLARSQTEDGRCWRCGEEVTLISRRQWFLRASAYNDENGERMDALCEWDSNSLGSQQAVLGRVEGFELNAATIDGRSLRVFAASVEHVGEAAFVAIAPGHPELAAWTESEQVRSELDALRTSGWVRADRKPDDVAIVDTTMRVTVPGVPQMLPVLVAPYVESRYGATALLGVPRDDETAAAIARRLSDRPPSIVRVKADDANAESAVRFSAGDFPISRQRGWGAPIPLVHCGRCGAVPVARDDLPVVLPDDLSFTGAGNPLDAHDQFIACECPSCGAPARRDTETLDCHVDALWIWIPACVPIAARASQMFTHPEVERWLPVHQIVWGLDGGAYILSQRTTAKMLRDAGTLTYLLDGEPFARALMHGMVKSDGRKMSKHLGNVVDPTELIARVGADTVRLAILHAAAPRNGTEWTERDVDLCHRFLKRLWRYVTVHAQQRQARAPSDTPDKHRRRLIRWCDTAIAKVTRDLGELQMHRAARNVMLLLERVEDFERRARDDDGQLSAADADALNGALRMLTLLLAPLTPHIAEELWQMLGGEGLVSVAPWPAAAVQ